MYSEVASADRSAVFPQPRSGAMYNIESRNPSNVRSAKAYFKTKIIIW